MRKLASVQTIDAIYPIEGKDRIVLARVEGWNVIVTKDFEVGDKVVYMGQSISVRFVLFRLKTK